MAVAEFTAQQIRRQWVRGHGLRDSVANDPTRGGWLHAIGGADVYVSARARTGATRKDSIDAALQAGALQVVTGARGCTMLVPRADAALALALSVHLGGRKAARDRDKLGVTLPELEKLCIQVRSALEADPATSMTLRKRLPEGAIRRFGDAGKKLGVSSSLPMALRHLESRGFLARCPEDGLDGRQYQWKLEETPLSMDWDAEALVAAVARSYWAHAGPARLDDFASWSSFGKRECKAAMAGLGLVDVVAKGLADGLMALPPTVDQMAADNGQDEHAPVLLGMRDPYWDHRAGLQDLLDPAHGSISVSMGRSTKSLSEVARLWQRAVLIDGKIAGFWEAEQDCSAIVVGTFAAPSPSLALALDSATQPVLALLRDSVGHARIYPMEPKGTRAKALGTVRAFPTRTVG